MAASKIYHDALLALSGNPVVAGARTALLVGISDNELIDVINYIIRGGIPRERLNAIATSLFDELATPQRVENGVAPGGDGNGGDDDDDDDDSDGAVRRARRKPGRNARQEESRPAQQRPTQTPTSRATRSSTATRKRKREELGIATNKRSNLSPGWSSDEGEPIMKEGSDREGGSEDTAITEPEDESSNTTKSASSISETDSDTDTSLDHDTPWKRTQKLSLMPDLDLEDSDNDDDLDYTEDLADQELLSSSGMLSHNARVPAIEICFLVPGHGGFERKKLADFPISFVKEVIRKFNGDYMKGLEKRRKYRKMIKEEIEIEMCVHCQQHPDHEQYGYMYDYTSRACSFCVNHKKLCARVERSDGGEVKLAVYPIGLPYERFNHWSSMAFWVHK